MGQAFDREGNILVEAFGETKEEVFKKLMKEQRDAHEIRIKTLEKGEQKSEFRTNQIEKNFTYHPPTEGQSQRYTDIRGMVKATALTIIAICPESRELSLAITKLEEAVFWANASIARNE
jgi:hypothetical protein